MDRRKFLRCSATGFLGLAVTDKLTLADAAECRKKAKKDAAYNVVILGDTHFDAEPVELYHTGYTDPNPTREANHRKEIARNIAMWKERCPKMLKRAACLVDENTKMTFQMGDLIQGDTGDFESHTKMLHDVVNYMKDALGPLPFVTVAGNHDLRGANDAVATSAYETYMPKRMSEELGKEITKTTFGFDIGPDTYIVIDFTHPDDAEIEKLLKESEGARYTFIIVHGPVFPYDSAKYHNWILHGRSDKTPEARRHFRKLFAKRNAIVLCGHTHTTEFVDWYGDGGRITQMIMNSVWAKDELAEYKVIENTTEEYGRIRLAAVKDKPETYEKDKALFDEYRSGIKKYSMSYAAGSYRLKVSDDGVTVDFYAGDSTRVTETFVLR